VDIPEVKTKPGPRYTPVSRRQDRPNAVLWLLRNHPELKDSQIIRLVGTTKPTIAAIRDRTHWNSANLNAQDPVALGLCSQIDLDTEVQKAAARLERERKEQRKQLEKAGTLLPTSETVPGLGPQPDIDLGDLIDEERPTADTALQGEEAEGPETPGEPAEDEAHGHAGELEPEGHSEEAEEEAVGHAEELEPAEAERETSEEHRPVKSDQPT
ncbi:MAG TPA: cell cycle transcriptional regulator TrcR, partial [Hyphomicrobiaceae bacterium]|nr:cell cycle transcriptional regulator TrcR [Hyphomicrobiaceae bacterium]